jgi:hypothetical protein
VIQLTLYLYQGKLSDMTRTDVAKFACALDGNMFKTNAQIVWDQMMNGLKTHSQNFTVENVLKRLGRPVISKSYEYIAKWNISSGPPGAATLLMRDVNRATNPTLNTTNVEILKKIQAQIAGSSVMNSSPLYTGVNDLTILVSRANDYNTAELQAVNGQFAALGWNAARQSESTVLYMNQVANTDGVSKTIALELMTIKPGDRIIITADEAVNVKKTQVWLVTDTPNSNANYPNVIDVPVEYVTRPFKNFTSSSTTSIVVG